MKETTLSEVHIEATLAQILGNTSIGRTLIKEKEKVQAGHSDWFYPFREGRVIFCWKVCAHVSRTSKGYWLSTIDTLAYFR